MASVAIAILIPLGFAMLIICTLTFFLRNRNMTTPHDACTSNHTPYQNLMYNNSQNYNQNRNQNESVTRITNRAATAQIAPQHIIGLSGQQRTAPIHLPSSMTPAARSSPVTSWQLTRNSQQQNEENRREKVDKLMELLPTFVPGPSIADDHCPVCLDPCGLSLVTMGTCMHSIHTLCLSSWLVKSEHNTCPLCRADLCTFTSS